MKRAFVALALLSLAMTSGGAAEAAPKHSICADIGPTFGVGVSHFSAAGTWDETAASQYGAKWKYLYWYIVYNNSTPAALASWIKGNVKIAEALGAIPVFTFFELHDLSKAHGKSGTEPQVVQQGLQDAAIMTAYYDQFIFLMKTLAGAGTPVIVQVEPDSWGFMIWAMGVNGNSNATSVPVKVGGSGHPDVAGFPDHAGGLGHALLKLRDQYAPAVRLGWHASNFRTGHGGDIVAKFYSSMGEWDALFSEHPHVEGDPKQWWLPWDDTKVTQNLSFYSTLTSAAHVPLLFWQEQVGTTDLHLLSADPTMRSRFAAAGVAGVLFSMRGQGNPDDFRADEDPNLATVPPAASGAGGTAKDMRGRVVSYGKTPLPWPAGFVCNAGGGGGAGGAGSSSSSSASSSGSAASSSSSSGSGAGGRRAAEADPAEDDTTDAEGVSCSFGGLLPADPGAPWLTVLAAGAIAALRRRRRG